MSFIEVMSLGFIQYDNLSLLSGMFSLFPFNVIIDIIGFMPAIHFTTFFVLNILLVCHLISFVD